ncbi:protein DpdG [Ramlibacter alkalitolerans]|uniref:Uncharacterized protein n=1 Tax=Ramlibacter alkalitolerans TaxID=2039631 RepID=A0ABS1JV01_9BURK|nr:protein DpdG [Ramlibacter alkalitolerans]MBL0427961.1 hypothetical protein [Ramlibacter alkalitolerans]
MFTDNPTIPAQLEVLLDVVHAMRQRKCSAEALRHLIQPEGLPGVKPNSAQVDNHLAAARELELVKADENQDIRLTYSFRGEHRAKPAILAAFDCIALANANVEKWAGRFYAYMIAQEDDFNGGQAAVEAFANKFMVDLPSSVDKGNPMNLEKHRALMRWYPYVGMGWVDPSGAFNADPTERLRRALPVIWEDERKLDAQEFMDRMGRACPELDGGALFNEVTEALFSASARQCTQALATALRRLHDEGVLRLHCPSDSKGWSLDRAGQSQVTGEASNRFDAVERVGRRSKA